jgi:hypothetical protein
MEPPPEARFSARPRCSESRGTPHRISVRASATETTRAIWARLFCQPSNDLEPSRVIAFALIHHFLHASVNFAVIYSVDYGIGIGHDFRISERVELTYCYVEPRPYAGIIMRVTPSSIHIKFDAEDTPRRIVVCRRQWRNEFGRAVSVSKSTVRID